MSGASRFLGPGWRGSAALLSIFSTSITVLLTILLFVSVFKLGGGSSSFSGTSLLFSGECGQASRLTVLLHLVINIIASIILASSNFFMQVLVAPTRQDVDKAHTRGRWLEIGVQSWRNIRFVPIANTIFWLMLAFTTIPLHLIFNSAVLESHASTGFLFVISTEAFIEGANSNGSLPIISRADGGVQPETREVNTLRNISKSIATGTWEKLNLQDCYQRYNTTTTIFTTYRHLVMVVSNQNETLGQTIDWSPAEVYRNVSKAAPANLTNIRSPMWDVQDFLRTDEFVNAATSTGNSWAQSLDFAISMNLSTDLFEQKLSDNATYSSWFQDDYLYMKAYYCLSEPWEAPCKVEIDNQLLGIVCLIGFIKTLLCAAILIRLKDRNPLMTFGDAIESFINIPDQTTAGMCSHSRNDFVHRKLGDIAWKPVTSAWRTPSRRAGSTIPWSIWIWSYAIITSCLVVAGYFYHEAAITRPPGHSYFGQDSRNPDLDLNEVLGTTKRNINSLIMLANLPQVLLSMAYMVYNGLFTRICSEFEWAAFSVRYLPLRVSLKKGQQQSTHRLQLPYHWSIPLLVVSTTLHWLFSNCLYLIIYEGYEQYWPYDINKDQALQYSTISILISLVICIGLALIPFILAALKLPGKMVIAGNCSAVISAACHCVPSSIPAPEKSGPINTTRIIEEDNLGENSQTPRREAVDLATGKLKWGAIPDLGYNETQPNDTAVGHLSFGSEAQGVGEVVEGDLYS